MVPRRHTASLEMRSTGLGVPFGGEGMIDVGGGGLGPRGDIAAIRAFGITYGGGTRPALGGSTPNPNVHPFHHEGASSGCRRVALFIPHPATLTLRADGPRLRADPTSP